MQNDLLPIILFDVDKKEISKKHITSNNCFYMYSYQIFSIKITDGTATIYSVKQLEDFYGQYYLETTSGQDMTDNYGYTLFIPTNNTEVTIEVTSINNVVTVYKIQLKLDNILTDENEHYKDILINNNLPTFEELEPAIFTSNKSEMIKRLLLDFKYIIRNKGTKTSIEKFFNLLGLNQNQLNILDEYFQDGWIDKPTTSPNKTKDIKSGNYQIIYDNFTEEGYDECNLPIRHFTYEDLSAFFDNLIVAIVLANKYFTLEEQDITYFGINYSSNISNKLSTTSTFHRISYQDILQFRRDLKINSLNYVTSDNINTVISNNIQQINTLYCSAVRYLREAPMVNQELFLIDEEIYRDTIYTGPLDDLKKTFGIINHLNITTINKWIEVKITNVANPLSQIIYNKTFIESELNLIYLTKLTGLHEIRINVWDQYNNKEEFIYNIMVDISIANVDFEIYTSNVLFDLEPVNTISTDVDSPTELSSMDLPENYILRLVDIPTDLIDYPNVIPTELKRWLSNTSPIKLPAINKNINTHQVTETISLELTEQWIEMISVEYSESNILMLRVFDAMISDYRLIPYNEIGMYQPMNDKLFVTLFDVVSDEWYGEAKPYYFIMTTQTGIDLKEIFDFVLVNKTTGECRSIYDINTVLTNDWYGGWYNGEWYQSEWYDTYWYGYYQDNWNLDITKKRMYVNYDFPLFVKPSVIVPDFNHYISESDYKVEIEGVMYAMVKSIFPRLINKDYLGSNEQLRLGDVFMCKLNEDYISEAVNIRWKLYNTFTNELITEVSNQYILAHRVDEQVCYTIECIFNIMGREFSIRKESVLTSFLSGFWQ